MSSPDFKEMMTSWKLLYGSPFIAFHIVPSDNSVANAFLTRMLYRIKNKIDVDNGTNKDA